jgi:hypothetical protein
MDESADTANMNNEGPRHLAGTKRCGIEAIAAPTFEVCNGMDNHVHVKNPKEFNSGRQKSSAPYSSPAVDSTGVLELMSRWDSRLRVRCRAADRLLLLYFGPAFGVEYTFGSHPMNEKHKRTTAFKDF